MRKKFFSVIFCFIVVFNTAFSTNYFSSEQYFYPGEIKSISNLSVDRYDYDSYLYIHLNNNQSLKNHLVQAKSKLNIKQADSCTYKMELYAFDRVNHNIIVEDEVYHFGNSDWSLVADININVDAEYAILAIYFENCTLSANASMDFKIAVDNDLNESAPPLVSFWADNTSLLQGQCTYLNWQVENSQSVKLNGVVVNDYDYTSVCPNTTTTYTLKVIGKDESSITKTVTIYVEEQQEDPIDPTDPPSVTFYADDYDLSVGECTYIYWETLNTTEVYLNDDLVPTTDYYYACPESTSDFTLLILGEDEQWYISTITINVDDDLPNPPAYAFYADAYDLLIGECTWIYWDVINAETVYYLGNLVESVGSEWVCPTQTTQYDIEIYGNDGGDYQGELTIYVEEETPAPINITFWSDTNPIYQGECTIIHWDVINAQQVIIVGIDEDHQDSMKVCPDVTKDYFLEAFDLNGKKYTATLTLTVEKRELSCRGDDGFILFVTDSSLLNLSTDDNTTWEQVKARLLDYYDSTANDCLGKAFFLDIAQLKKESRPSHKFIDKAIEDFIEDKNISYPYAVTIIGGPNVIPHEPPPEKLQNLGFSDDLYADFDHDKLGRPDCIITRLPDGGQNQVLLNYINALEGGNSPPDGALYVTDIKNSAHKLNFSLRFVSLATPDPFKDKLFLEDFISLQTPGNLTHLLTPPHDKDYFFLQDTPYQHLIRSDDQINAKPEFPTNNLGRVTEAGIYTFLNKRIIVFGEFAISKDLSYYVSNSLWSNQGSQMIYSPFSFAEAHLFPEGGEVFSLVGNSALLSADSNPANLIPIAALNAGVHHFIGRTSNRPVLSEKMFTYEDQTYWDMSVEHGPGKFAAEFFQITSNDPAVSFFSAKSTSYDLIDQSAKYFLYLGLPERNIGESWRNNTINRYPPPNPNTITEPPQLANCPSAKPEDCDGDGLPDDTEHMLANTFAPYLIPDEDEDQLPIHHTEGEDPFGVFWQVSPAVHEGKTGAWITYVFTYTSDGGAHDFDIDFTDCAKCVANTALSFCKCGLNPKSWPCCVSKALVVTGATVFAPITLKTVGATCAAVEIGIDWATDFGINYNTQRILSYHPGDNEAFRVFIEDKGDGTWEMTHINWKRHHDGFDHEGHLQSVTQAQADGLEFYYDTHPLLYVAEDKHAMYPSHDSCEGYEMEIKSGCKISFEHCSGHPIYNRENPIKTLILKELNVGEHTQVMRSTSRVVPVNFHLFEDMGPVFPGENAWEMRDGFHFCGSLSPGGGLIDTDCAGPMGKLWFQKSRPLDID